MSCKLALSVVNVLNRGIVPKSGHVMVIDALMQSANKKMESIPANTWAEATKLRDYKEEIY